MISNSFSYVRSCLLVLGIVLFLSITSSAGAAVTNPPSFTSVSQDEYTDRIDLYWNAGNTPEENGWQLYRSLSNNSASAVLIQDWIFAGTNGPGRSWSDTTVEAGKTYYYWIKAFDQPGSNRVFSGFSVVGIGSTVSPPDAPTGVDASDGVYTDRVFIAWTAATNADGYAVYRSTSTNEGSAVLVQGWIYDTNYTDTTVASGVTYYYRVKSFAFNVAASQYLYSVLSELDSGFANQDPIAQLTASPTNGFAPLRVTLDCSGAYDPDGELVLVEIDREGNGIYETSMSEAGELVVEYTSSGTFSPQVRVTDNFGKQATASCTVTVVGDGPTAVIEPSATNGTAPLTVTFVGTNSTAGTGQSISVYEWDFDGDGTYDRVSVTGITSWVYGSAGTNMATLRVTDSSGLQDTDSRQIVVTAPADPPVVTLSNDVSSGSIPLAVTFTANVSGGGTVSAYKWDFDGDGAYDFSSSANTSRYTYTSAGVYPASVTVVDDAGLTDSDNVVITASVAQVLKVWVSTPKEGAQLWGEKVTLRANTAPGHLTKAVRFEYKRDDEVSWTTLGSYIYAPPNSFATNWDVTGLSDGSNYNLRARALDTNDNPVVSEVVTVTIDSGALGTVGAVVESVVGGKQQKEQTFSKDATTEIGISDGTQVTIAAGTVDANTTVEVILIGQNTNSPNGSCAGKAAIAANRTVSLEGDPALSKSIELIIPYPDEDDDGIVDGTGVPEMTLVAHWYDTVAGEWRRALSTEINTEENYLKATTYHLTEFGLFGSKNLLHPANGSVLESYTSEDSGLLRVENLTDDNTISYWRSETNPATPQEMVYSFKDDESALLTGAGIYNHGDGSEGYSRTFQIQGSINGTDYTVLTNGILTATRGAQVFDFGMVTCRTVRLIISDGVATDGWELSEFELYGDTTPDADHDTLVDAWEVQYFGDLVSNSATNDSDNDGLNNTNEVAAGTDPTKADTDDDGMDDGDEVIAGTSATNENEVFIISEFDAYGSGAANHLHNDGFETGWNPINTVPYWYDNIPAGTVAGAWGDVGLSNGVVHGGTNVAYIRNHTGTDSLSGFWQQITNNYAVGTVWEIGAWVYSDAAYTNVQCEMKLEFLNAADGYIYVDWNVFSAPGDTWTYVSGIATAPVGTVKLRFVMASVGQGADGAFLFDDCYLAPESDAAWIVTWDSVLDRTYRIYESTSIGVWTNIVHQTAGTGGQMAYTNRLTDETDGFMRVTVERD